MKKIGIVGLGIMSRGMTRNFLKHEYEVYVWNRTESVADDLVADGAVKCASPAGVCKSADIIFEVTANDESSRAVWLGDDGILSAADENKTLVASATLSVGWVDELAQQCGDAGYSFFDIPLTGGRMGADSGNLILLVGGDKQKLDELQPTLDAIAAKVFYFGEAGHGTRYKLLLNGLQAMHMAGYGEVMNAAERAGMDVDKVGSALAEHPGGFVTKLANTNFRNPPEPINFSVEWITKDLTYAKEFIGTGDAPMLDTTLSKFKNVLDRGRGQKDWSDVNEKNETVK